MSAATENASPYSSINWADVISAGGKGASSALQGRSAEASSKREAKEAKRRTLANIMNSSIGRSRDLFNMGQEHSNDMNDFQSQAIRQIAQGFVQSLQGSTGRKI